MSEPWRTPNCAEGSQLGHGFCHEWVQVVPWVPRHYRRCECPRGHKAARQLRATGVLTPPVGIEVPHA